MKTDLLFSSYPYINGETVTLSRLTDMDWDALWTVMGAPENYRFSPVNACATPREMQKRVSRADALFQSKKAILLGIATSSFPARLLGLLELTGLDPQTECVSLHFVWKRGTLLSGLADATVTAAVNYFIQSVGANRIQVLVMPEDQLTCQLLTRCGFVAEGTLREATYWPDRGVVTLTLYSLLPGDLLEMAHQNEGMRFSI